MVKRVAFADDSKGSGTGADCVIIHDMSKRVSFRDPLDNRRKTTRKAKKEQKGSIDPFDLAELPADLRLEVYKQFNGPDTQHGKHTVPLYLSGYDDSPQWTDGKPDHSQLPGSAFVEATSTSLKWTEEKKVATKVIWSSVILQIDMSTMTSSYGANLHQQDRVWNQIVDKNPVHYIPNLRFCHFDALFYFIRPTARVIWPDTDVRLGASVYDDDNPTSWRSRFTGVRTVEVICNHPMLPSTYNEAKVLETLKSLSANIQYDRKVLEIEDLASALRKQLPKLQQLVLRSRRNFYFLDLQSTSDGKVVFKLKSVQRSVNVCGCTACYWIPGAIC